MKCGFLIKTGIILLASLFFTHGSLYAQDDQERQGGNASGRPGPAATWTPNLQGKQGGSGTAATWSKEGQGLSGPNIETPNIETPNIPAPLQLSASQQAMLNQAAAKNAAKQAAAQKEAAKQAAANQTAANQPADQQSNAQQSAFDEKGVPFFGAPQVFPKGSVQKLPPISQINVPSPSLPPECTVDCEAGLANDLKNSRAWAFNDNCDDDFSRDLATLQAVMDGIDFGKIAGREGFSSEMDNVLDSGAGGYYSFAFQLGFLQGLMASECDPDMYLELFNHLMEKMIEAEGRAKKNQIDMFAPCVPSGGGGKGGGSSSGGGGGPC